MNYVVLTGKITGEIVSQYNDNMRSTKFNLHNLYYSPTKNATDKTVIRCIAYGALAEYVNNELYEGASILVVGRILNRTYIVNNTYMNRLYVGCNAVTKLEQEEYC